MDLIAALNLVEDDANATIRHAMDMLLKIGGSESGNRSDGAAKEDSIAYWESVLRKSEIARQYCNIRLNEVQNNE